jgi:predicted ribosomally synthesized peptide with SipW-like signal peptide
MKKINSKNKKARVILVTVIAFIMVAGSAYAWWYSTTSVDADIRMGKLNVESDFSKVDVRAYEPGDVVSSKGTVKNTGNIAAVVSMKENTQISFVYADDDFNPWTGDKWVPDKEDAVKSDFYSTEGYGFHLDVSGNVVWCWFVNRADPTDKYLLLAPGAKISLAYDANLDGEVMTRKYQGALIKIIDDLKSTQTMDGAMKKLFGITYDDLDIYTGRDSSARNDVPESVMMQIKAMFHH